MLDHLSHAKPTERELAAAIELALPPELSHCEWQLLLITADGLRSVCRAAAGDPSSAPSASISWTALGGAPVKSELAAGQIVARASEVDASDGQAAGATQLLVPINLIDHSLGVLVILCDDPQSAASAAAPLTELAVSLAPALDRLRLTEEVEVRVSQLVLLGEISRRLIGLRPLEERWSDVTPLISQLLDFAEVHLFELVGDRLTVRAVSHRTDSNEPSELAKSQVSESIAAMAPLLKPNSGNSKEAPASDSQLSLPMMVEDRVLGGLHLRRDGPGGFSPDDQALAEMLTAQLAISALEAHNYAQQQEYTWFNAVLLEVAKHAALPGEPVEAMRAVLQLTTMLAGARWTLLLTPTAEDTLEASVSSGLSRDAIEQIQHRPVLVQSLGISPPYVENDKPLQLDLPESLAAATGDSSSIAMVLTDGTALLGLLLIGGPPPEGPRRLLLSGIAHQLSLRIENSRLIERLAAQRSIERELETARRIQHSFLPESLPDVANWQMGATWQSARQVGGDFFDLIPLDEGARWGVVIADVADKGVPAALFMALCRTLLRSVAPDAADAADALTRVNQVILSDSRAELFVSMVYGIWEPDSGRFKYANAGHNPPLLIDGNGARWLSEHGMVLGVSERARFETIEIELEPGSLLLLYTDGVTEAINPEGSFYGTERLAQYVDSARNDRAQVLAESILAEIRSFVGADDPSDDLTVLVLRRQPEATE